MHLISEKKNGGSNKCYMYHSESRLLQGKILVPVVRFTPSDFSSSFLQRADYHKFN